MASRGNQKYNTFAAHCPVASRDRRVFLVGFRGDNQTMDWIEPWAHKQRHKLDELDGNPAVYHYHVGRGIGGFDSVRRRLEDGVLPVESR